MSDPLWFLENFEENESKSDQKEYSLNYSPQENSGQEEWFPETINSEDKSVQGSSQTQDKLDMRNSGEDKKPQVLELDILKDEESLRTALQNSLLESIKNGQNPEIQITVNSKPENYSSGLKLEGNNNVDDTTSQKEKSKIVITLNKKENGQAIGEEKKFVINNSNGQKIEVDENAGTNQQSKVYVILPPNQNNQLNTEANLTGDTNTQYCEEVGSTVINLNDLISFKENTSSNHGEITANVDLSSVIGSSESVPKVQLVIKVKDEREKSDQTTTSEDTAVKSYSEKEIARLRELLKNSASLENLDSQLQSGKVVKNIPIKMVPSTSSHTSSTWQTTNYKSVYDTVDSQKPSNPYADWVDKSTDSYVRKDGAQCTRTVWSTPQGRRVETKCFKDERATPKGKRARDVDWLPNFGSFWSDLDDDIDRLFSRRRIDRFLNRFL